MTYVYFHCIGPSEILIDNQGAEVVDLAEARDHALMMARSLVESAYGTHDFSEWHIYVGDEDDDEMLLVPFTAALPTLH